MVVPWWAPVDSNDSEHATYRLILNAHWNYCLAHARRKFDELVKANASVVSGQAIQRIAWLYRVEADAKTLTAGQRLPRTHRVDAQAGLRWRQLIPMRVQDESIYGML